MIPATRCDERTNWRELRDYLPKPYNVDRDADETVYFIKLGRCTLEVECSLEDYVQCLNIYVTPTERED